MEVPMLLKNDRILAKKDFANEKELQQYFESNLLTILNLRFIDTEFTVDKYRIDTVAFDVESKSFRIIEYKNIRNKSLIDQGFTYLKVLHERKADFLLNYNSITGEQLKLTDVDWSQSRIIFVAPTFTNYQLDATDFKNLPFDLYKINRYEGDVVVIDSVGKSSNIKLESIGNYLANDVLKEIKVYTEDDHLSGKPDKVVQLYNNLKEDILNIGDIAIDPKKSYIAFKGSRNIIDIEIQNKALKMHLNLKKGQLEDARGVAIDQSEIGHWGNGDYRVMLNSDKDLDYVLYLIKQSYEVNK